MLGEESSYFCGFVYLCHYLGVLFGGTPVGVYHLKLVYLEDVKSKTIQNPLLEDSYTM